MTQNPNSLLFVNPDNRGVYDTPSLTDLSATIPASIAAVEAHYQRDPEAYIRSIANSLRSVPNVNGSKEGLPISLFYDNRTANAESIGLVFSPLNDVDPESENSDEPDVDGFIDYILNPEPTKEDREKVQPGTWSQAIKTADLYETKIEEGVGEPLVVIYAMPPKSVFEAGSAQQIREGKTTPWGSVAEAALKFAEDEIHGPSSQQKFENVNIYAPGLGHNAVGAADYLRWVWGRRIASMTLPNLIADMRQEFITKPEVLARKLDIAKTFARYSIFQHHNDTPNVTLDSGLVIPESALRAKADILGSGSHMRKNQTRALFDFADMRPMVRSDWIGEKINEQMDEGTKVTLPRARNAAITARTDNVIDTLHPNLTYIIMESGVEDKNADLMTNEYVKLGSILGSVGAARARRR
jgi:hypothetical protein